MEQVQHTQNSSTGTRLLDDITLAVSTQWHAFPERFDWIAANGFGMAYTPEAMQLHRTEQHTASYLEKGIPIRYHGFFPGFEIGDADGKRAAKALTLHKKALDVIHGVGEQLMTVHVGLVPSIALDYQHVVDNLCRLADYAHAKGITICLENLRTGLTSNPETVVELAEKCNTSITLDVGHAVSCDRVVAGSVNVVEIVEMFAHALEEVHFYEYETDTHYAPKDMSILGPIVDALCATECTWWTIELNCYEDILNTRRLVGEYLATRVSCLVA